MIKQNLQRFYSKLLIPIIFLITAALIIKVTLPDPWISDDWAKVVGILLFVSSTVSALVAPLLYRLVLIRRFKEQQNVEQENFLSFQKNTVTIALSTFYFFCLALLTAASELVYMGIFLLALYSAYFYFPSQKRIDFEMHLFRVRD